MNQLHQIIKRPVVSEKSTALAELGNRYVFEVESSATKPQIRDAIQQIFNVRVRAVRTAVMHGKTKRAGRSEFKRSNWKKAIVTLADGDRIELFQVTQ